MSQPEWQSQVQNKAREAGQKVRDFAQSEQVKQTTDKLKTRWLGLSGRNKIIVVCVGLLCLYLVWHMIGGGGSSYTVDALASVVTKDSKAAKKQLEATWITVTGSVDRAAYLPDGGLLIPQNTSCIKLSSQSDTFSVEGFFEGPKSGGVETDSLSRGDTVTIKGKVDIVGDNVVGLHQCTIASVRRR